MRSYLVIAALSLVTIVGEAPTQVGMAHAQAQTGLYGLPTRMRNLTDLTPIIDRQDLTSLQKTEVLLAWLGQERSDPSPTTTGLGGGPIDSSYIQAQMIKGLGTLGDPQAIDWLLSNPQVTDESLRNACRLALGLMGDQRQIPMLVKILREDPDANYRTLAVEDLNVLGAAQALPDIERALQDRYSVTFDHMHKGRITFYPVREAATAALRVLKDPHKAIKLDPEGFAHKQDRIRQVAVVLANKQQYLASNKGKLPHLLTLVKRVQIQYAAKKDPQHSITRK